MSLGASQAHARFFGDLCRRCNVFLWLCIKKKDLLSKGAAVAKYTALADERNLYAAGYMDYLPSEEELEHVLECNRRAFELAGEVRALERGCVGGGDK